MLVSIFQSRFEINKEKSYNKLLINKKIIKKGIKFAIKVIIGEKEKETINCDYLK
jgi:hypothetical protein